MKSEKIIGLISIAFVGVTVLTLSINGAIASLKKDEANWNQNSSGWRYKQGNSYCTGWNDINGKKYYFDEDGYMKTGWLNDDKSWYYLESNGAMKRGHLKDNGSWYYLDKSGAMRTGLVFDGLRWLGLEEDGQMDECSLKINGDTYYLKADEESELENKTYYLISDRNILMKNSKLGNITTDENGKVINDFESYTELDGWELVDNKRYFYDYNTNEKAVGWVEQVGKQGNIKYYFDENGAMKTGWFVVDEKKYYANNEGIIVTGLKKVDDKLYLFNENGELNTTMGIVVHDGESLFIDEDASIFKLGDNNKISSDIL